MLNWEKIARLLFVMMLPVMAVGQGTVDAAVGPDPVAALLQLFHVSPGPVSSGPAAVPAPETGAVPVAAAKPVIKVEYHDRQLFLLAKDASLQELLAEVSARTGIEIEVAPEVSSEKMDIELGPGDAREVLVKLLSSPHLDYIMLGTAAGPDAVGRIQVTANAGPVVAGAGAPEVASAANPEQTEEEPGEAAPPPAALTSAQRMLSPDELADYWKRAQENQTALERERNLRQIQLIDEMAEEEKKQKKQQEQNKPPNPK